jgi:hypothetical protein
MEKDKILKAALEIVKLAEQNPIFKDVSDEELANALLGVMLTFVCSGNKTTVCITIEIAREVIRRFQQPQQTVEVPVEHI